MFRVVVVQFDVFKNLRTWRVVHNFGDHNLRNFGVVVGNMNGVSVAGRIEGGAGWIRKFQNQAFNCFGSRIIEDSHDNSLGINCSRCESYRLIGKVEIGS